MAKAARNPQRNNRQDDSDLILTTPYNFVPLSKKVVRPSWAHLISHDKPFKDGLSGELKLTIKAEQPIFTRTSVSRRVTDEEKKKEENSHFSQAPDGRYFLPGSSIKGAIRNVLEIMSFGDLAKGLNEERYGMRDLHHEDYKAMFAINSNHKVHGGWLFESNGAYLLNDCGEPIKVPQSWIDQQFNTNHFGIFAEGSMKMDDNYKAARKKYDLFAEKNLEVELDGIKGTLVFTGQPAANTKARAKVNEFLFPKSEQVLEVSKEVVNNFKLAYYDSDRNAQKPDYKHWSSELKAGRRIPVFFHKNEKNEVVSFGLAYMYKIPFTYSVKEAVLRHQKASGKGPDLAECLFGHVEKNNPLRGRVIFGHAFAADNPREAGPKDEVLNNPKATYYPTYIRQKVDAHGKVSHYDTLFDKDAVPSGWKRYPVHQGDVKENPGPKDRNGNYNKKIQTRIRPLPAGTAFTCTVNFHNLTPVELGAFLSALTFHNTEGCFHTFGMAKPLGYGKCKVTVEAIQLTGSNKINPQQQQNWLSAFEQYMEGELRNDGGWLKSDQMRELLSMSVNQENTGRSALLYMNDVKKFAEAKKQKLALDCYTKLDGISPQIPKTVSTDSATRMPNSSPNPREIFEQKKQELIQRLVLQRDTLKRKEDQERQDAEKLRKEEEAEKLRKEKEEGERAREEARLKTELSGGINLNGVQANKTIEGLLRTLKRWKETLNGDIDTGTITKIKQRFTTLYDGLKPREKQPWVSKLKNDLPALNAYLDDQQTKELEAHINEFP